MYHGYLPAEFMKTAIVPIIKCKTGNTADKNNYRPFALVTACFKIFEICLLDIIEKYLDTHDQGRKSWGDGGHISPPCFDMGGITCLLSPHVLTLKSVGFFCSGKLIMFYNVCF